MGFFVGAAVEAANILFVGAAVGFMDMENFVGATRVGCFLGRLFWLSQIFWWLVLMWACRHDPGGGEKERDEKGWTIQCVVECNSHTGDHICVMCHPSPLHLLLPLVWLSAT